jgi:hypothetical protein
VLFPFKGSPDIGFIKLLYPFHSLAPLVLVGCLATLTAEEASDLAPSKDFATLPALATIVNTLLRTGEKE